MAHIHELYDFTASAFIVYKDKVLLLHHAKLNIWLQPGGHIELDEDIEQALWREVEEETGIKATNLRMLTIEPFKAEQSPPSNFATSRSIPLPFHIDNHAYNDKHRHIDFTYLLIANEATTKLEVGAAHDIGWFSAEQMATKQAAGDLLPHTYQLALYAISAAKQGSLL